MNILALDTTTDLGGVAVGRDGLLEGAMVLRAPRRYSETLIPSLEFLLGQLSRSLEEMDLIAVTTGPGSFTGVRIGLAVARALGQSRQIPGLGLSTLEAVAGCFEDDPGPIAALLDARRQQVFAGLYTRGKEGEVELSGREQVVRPEVLLENLPPAADPLFVGTGAATYQGLIREAYPGARLALEQPPVLRSLIRVAHRTASVGIPVEEIRANYVRPSDAELGTRA